MAELLGFHDICRLVPEGRPLLMIDRLEIDTAARSACGIKAVSMDEHFFQGHFPGAPIMPGVLQIAAMAQAGGILAQRVLGQAPGRFSWLTVIRRLKFRKPVYPGDRLVVRVELADSEDPALVVLKARTEVNGEVTCQGELGLRDKTREQLTPPVVDLAPPLHRVAWADYSEAVDINGITAVIPHRFPFLLVDRVLCLDLENMRIAVMKQVTGNEPFMAGVPAPVVPAYIQAEIGAQAGCILALSLPENRGKLAYFMSIDEGRFEEPVVPGDAIVIDVVVSGRGRFGKAEGTAFVGDRPVSTIGVKFAVVDPEP
jgi:3-hydroxymyristoyl/3-hydroxydecanoyl-(acyl carrier protein) dehydratase